MRAELSMVAALVKIRASSLLLFPTFPYFLVKFLLFNLSYCFTPCKMLRGCRTEKPQNLNLKPNDCLKRSLAWRNFVRNSKKDEAKWLFSLNMHWYLREHLVQWCYISNKQSWMEFLCKFHPLHLSGIKPPGMGISWWFLRGTLSYHFCLSTVCWNTI